MKKKIIYISGAESFEVQDVKDAFEEVRKTLKLGTDTLLFGVPVEEFAACADASDNVVMTDSVANTTEIPKIEETVAENIDVPEVVAQSPKKTTRKKQSVAQEVVVQEPVAQETVAHAQEQVVEDLTDVAVPILSVLSSNVSVAAQEDDVEVAQVLETDKQQKSKEEFVEQDDVSDEILTTGEPDLEPEDVADMVKDDMPADETEKTLEKLLETMTPLREDAQPEIKNEESDMDYLSDESDTTLESLASEFAENQDNLLPPKKSAQRSKIGKLKNILPFKKMKREDPGIMGDLFGWAGIAANDEEFTIPGFFTGVASKN